jgi:hypothetical protein
MQILHLHFLISQIVGSSCDHDNEVSFFINDE